MQKISWNRYVQFQFQRSKNVLCSVVKLRALKNVTKYINVYFECQVEFTNIDALNVISIKHKKANVEKACLKEFYLESKLLLHMKTNTLTKRNCIYISEFEESLNINACQNFCSEWEEPLKEMPKHKREKHLFALFTPWSIHMLGIRSINKNNFLRRKRASGKHL